jgi:hypothetical protein
VLHQKHEHPLRDVQPLQIRAERVAQGMEIDDTSLGILERDTDGLQVSLELSPRAQQQLECLVLRVQVAPGQECPQLARAFHRATGDSFDFP